MNKTFLNEYQLDAVNRMFDGCILNGGVGSGKSRTGLYYYFKEFDGAMYDGIYNDMRNPMDLYIITTAKKRDSLEWEQEMMPFLMSPKPEINIYKNKIVIDSWNNISKYSKIRNAFFIFDEDRVTGTGKWVQTFLNIAKNNRWIILSATPGDTWEQYIPVFVANGFYKNRTDFINQHVVYKRWVKFPCVDKYLNVGRLVRLRNKILIDMEYKRHTIRNHEDIIVGYNKDQYKSVMRDRWNIFTNKPIKQASELCQCLRRIVNTDISRQEAILDLVVNHPRCIIFYNYDYELDILSKLKYLDREGNAIDIYQWNGHMHQEIPDTDEWVYLVQYNAGCEGWNCIKTDTIIFYSANYSYKIVEQSCGRIDRMNTPFTNLYYYHLRTTSSIDLAIKRAYKNKKKFNETKFIGGL